MVYFTLNEPSPTVRLEAIRALGAMGVEAKNAVPSLRTVLFEPDTNLQQQAADALVKIGSPSIPALVEATLDAAERRNMTTAPATVEEALHIDHVGRAMSRELLPEIAAKSS